MSYIYSRSFTTPEKRRFEDGRGKAASAIRKVHRDGPQAPDALLKTADDIGAHRTSKSVNMVKRAHAHALPVTDNRLPSADELNKAFAEQAGRLEVDLDELEPYRGHATSFRSMTPQELRKRDLSKLATPRRLDPVTDNYNRGAPQSSNSQWNDVHANTGASNDWHDQIAPTTKPTRITFHQFGTPGRSSRDDAVEAIKQDLTKPKRMGASPNVDDSFAQEM